MPSLICRWEGRCLDPQMRADLTACLLELAQCNKLRWEGLEIPRPDFLVIPREEAERRARETELVRMFDGPITGRIVIEPKLATYEELQTDGSAPARPIEGPADWSIHEAETSCVAYSEGQERWLAFVPPTVDLGGVDFRLYDPRGLYPGEDRVSFLFVRCPQWPALDGKIVAAESHVQCQSYESELVRSADWLLARPSIHLRYYLEEWFDLLLSWVKRYFVDDLYYWRGEDFSQYESMTKMMDELSETQGAAAAKQAIFKNLLDRFQEETDQLGESVVRMALEGTWSGRMERQGVELESVDVDGEIRCGTCGPQIERGERRASQGLSVRELYEQLRSQRYGEAVDAVKGLIAAGPDVFGLVHRALGDPQLAELRPDFLFELAQLGAQALPLAKAVARCLDTTSVSLEVVGHAAYALSKMGNEADQAIHAWMDETSSPAWEAWPNILFQLMGVDRSMEFLRTALQADSIDRNLWACQMIATDRTHSWEALTSTLVERLDGDNPQLKADFAKALAAIETPEAPAQLPERDLLEPEKSAHEELPLETSIEERLLDAQVSLYGSDEWESRQAAAELIDIGLPALPMLISGLADPRVDRRVRGHLLDAIESLGPAAAPAIPHVMRFLNPEVADYPCSVKAQNALMAIGEAAVTPLIKRMRTVAILEWPNLRGVFSLLRSDRVVQELVALLAEPDGDLRIRICDVLQHRTTRDESGLIIPALIELLKTTDSHVRAAAARALGHAGEMALPKLLSLAHTNEATVRAASLHAIAECVVRYPSTVRGDNAGVWDTLTHKLEDGHSIVRTAAAVALQRAATAVAGAQLTGEITEDIGCEDQLLAIRGYLVEPLRPGWSATRALAYRVAGHRDLRLRRMSAAALLACGEAASDGVLDTMRQALADPEDPNRDVYLVAAQRGGYWSAPLLPVIAFYLRPLDPLCATAIESVAAIGIVTDEVVDGLIDCLQRSQDAQVREAAAEALGRLAPPQPRVIDALVSALHDDPAGRIACEALGKMRGAAANAAKDIEAVAYLGHWVPEALARIGTPEAIAALWRIYNDWNHWEYDDRSSRSAWQDLYDRAHAELCRLGELPDPGEKE